MSQRTLATALTLFLLFPTLAAADLQCFYVITYNLVDFGGGTVLLPSVEYVCSDVITVTPPPPPPFPPPPEPPPPPPPPPDPTPTPPLPPSSMQIMYVSDENPHDVYFGISYLGSITNIRIFKNGAQINYLPTGDTSVVHIGNLDNFIDSYSTITVQVCNASGCADDSAHLVRQSFHRDTFGWLTVQYTISHLDQKVDNVATYDRSAGADYFTADWDKTVEGPHNGHYQHVQTRDALLWNTATGPFGTTNPAPLWDSAYRFYPSWLSGGVWEDSESPCTYGGYGFDFSNVHCANLGEFAIYSSPQGIFRVVGTHLGNDLFTSDIMSGDITLQVQP